MLGLQRMTVRWPLWERTGEGVGTRRGGTWSGLWNCMEKGIAVGVWVLRLVLRGLLMMRAGLTLRSETEVGADASEVLESSHMLRQT